MTELTSFLNTTAFPPYSELPQPGEIGFDPNHPEEHWCFLGEIVSGPEWHRMRTVVKDIEGTTIVVAFYLDHETADRIQDKLLSDWKKRQTLAIFYATQHYFMDGTEGVRVENVEYAKVFPLRLDSMFEVSRDIYKYNQMENGKRLCHGCNEHKEALSKCGRCGFFFYCGKDCQVKGWNEGRHKVFCKTLRDPDFRKMLEWRYEPFQLPRFKFSSHAITT